MLLPAYLQQWQWAVSFFVLAIGFNIVANQAPAQLPIYWQKTPLLISGSYEVIGHQQERLQLQVHQLRFLSPPTQNENNLHHSVPSQLSGKLLLTSYDTQQESYFRTHRRGCLVAEVVLKKPHNYNNDNGFDYVIWSQRNALLANGYIKSHIQQWRGCIHPLAELVGKVRDNVTDKIQAVPTRAIVHALWQGLIVGDTRGLQNQDWQILHRTGTTHLLIISGLHIGLVAGLMFVLWQSLVINIGKPQLVSIGIIISLLGAVGYAILSGWGIPAQRAVIMLVFVSIGQFKGIGWPLWQRLAFAMFFTMIVKPSSIYSMGFWFSYVAVLNIALFWHFFHTQKTGLAAKLWHGLLSQIGLMAVLLPTIAFATGGLSIIGPLLNLLLIPLFAIIIVPLLLGVSVLLLFISADHYVFLLVSELLILVWDGLVWLAKLPYAFINVTAWPQVVWLIWLAIGLLGLLLGKFSRVLCVALVILLIQPQWNHRDQLTLFDVGQGLALWMQSGQQHLLYDLGDRYPSGFDLMSRVVLPVLKNAGVEAIERVYVSHWDRDHSGGIQTLLSPYFGLAIQSWVLPVMPPPASLAKLVADIPNQRMCRPSQWQTFNNLRIRHLAPALEELKAMQLGVVKSTKNNLSCVIQADIGGVRFLLVGDIEKWAEQQLIKDYGYQLRSDVLIAPHHGSKTSSSNGLLEYVNPRVALISAGYLNRFKHPHPDVLNAYWQRDIVWYSTAIHGQITVHVDQDSSWQIAHR